MAELAPTSPAEETKTIISMGGRSVHESGAHVELPTEAEVRNPIRMRLRGGTVTELSGIVGLDPDDSIGAPEGKLVVRLGHRKQTGEDSSTNKESDVVSPETTTALIDRMLNTPDERGRMIPQLRQRKALYKEEDSFAYGLTYYDDETSTESSIGSSVIEFDPDSREARFSSVIAHPGKGYGRRIYLDAIKLALEEGYDFRSDVIHTSEDAVAMWKWLEEAGVAKKVDEFERIPGSTDYHGYYVVNGNNRPKLPMVAE